MAFRKKTVEIEDKYLCEGISISSSIYEQKENRLFTLILKGLIVYLLSMGSIGFYLSAFYIEYNVALCHIFIFITAFLCAMLYYRLFTENLGYFILLIAFSIFVVAFVNYINSGYYAIVNITTDNASQYFGTEIQRFYNERIFNRYLTITCAVMFIGMVSNILLNIYISRRMQYITAGIIVLTLNLIPVYFTAEPDTLYTIMIILGLSLTFVYKASGHYSPQVSVKRSDRKYGEPPKKKRFANNQSMINQFANNQFVNNRFANSQSSKKKSASSNKPFSYVYDIKGLLQAGIVTVTFVSIILVVVITMKPKETFNVGYQKNDLKKESEEIVETVLTNGIGALYEFLTGSQNVGGLQTGELGRVSSINVDNEPDVFVEFTPYTYDRIYLKNFTGTSYLPFENIWVVDPDMYNMEKVNYFYPEGRALRDAYDEGYEYSAKGTMKLTMADDIAMPSPAYYIAEIPEIGFQEEIFYETHTYYPRFEENDTQVFDPYYYDETPFTRRDFSVPEQNIEAIQTVILENNISGTNEQIINKVIDYFQEEIPYTINPGRVPRGKDFVNYFLLEGKKGYCSYYASSAVLIFRYLGIPARYAEGYAIDYYQISQGTMVDEDGFSRYYDGYSPIGETAIVEVAATDADAHAWVEVYDPIKGWYPVDVTPYSNSEEDDESFWDMFENMEDMEEEGADFFGPDGFKIPAKLLENIKLAIIIIVIFTTIIYLTTKGYKSALNLVKYIKADINDRLIIKYGRFYKKRSRRDIELRTKKNYEEQILYLYDKAKAKKRISKGTTKVIEIPPNETIKILNKAGFSNKLITKEEYNKVITLTKYLR